jgi:arylsulfatase A-like enzyme
MKVIRVFQCQVVQVYVQRRSAMIRKDNWKYCFYTGDTEELYNMETDPFELHNLAHLGKYSEMKEQLKNALLEWVLTEPFKIRN